MPKIITDERKRKINVNVSMSAETIARFDDNIDRLKNDFKSLGMDERELRRTISRSGLIGEFVELLATPQGYGMIRNVISLVLGVDFKQGELFDE
jgi:hypothetical protein